MKRILLPILFLGILVSLIAVPAIATHASNAAELGLLRAVCALLVVLTQPLCCAMAKYSSLEAKMVALLLRVRNSTKQFSLTSRMRVKLLLGVQYNWNSTPFHSPPITPTSSPPPYSLPPPLTAFHRATT